MQRLLTMTSSFSPPIEIFMVFIFAVANLSVKTVKICTMRKFRYTVHMYTNCIFSRLGHHCDLNLPYLSEIQEMDSNMQYLVYENHSKFIKASESIGEVSQIHVNTGLARMCDCMLLWCMYRDS